MTKDEALKLAFAKVRAAMQCHPNAVLTLLCEVDELLEKVLAQSEQEQEPVAWRVKVKTKLRDGSVAVGYQTRNERMSEYDEPLYEFPPKRPWVGLTDAEIDNLNWGFNVHDFVRAIEAKLKEKNT